jgi:hypothetical protein
MEIPAESLRLDWGSRKGKERFMKKLPQCFEMQTVAWTLLVIALMTTGCRHPRAVTPVPSGRTVLVTNHSLSAQRIYLAAGDNVRFLGAINPGETLCRELPAGGGNFQLLARSVERVIATPSFNPVSAAAWALELSVTGRYDGLNMAPADEACAVR